MNSNLISRYIWLVDLLNRYGKLTRSQINKYWLRSQISDGNPLPERSFFHYRRAIEKIFHIEINCNRQGEYYINASTSKSNSRVTNWLLDSYAINSAFEESPAAANRIEVEDVPSARQWLPNILEAIRNSECISFTYAGFNRSRAEAGILFRPYFLKRYKQRWYMAGLREKTNDIRTYALDRITACTLLDRKFEVPDDLTAEDLFGNIIGITSSKADVRTVKLRATPMQAKYFRALPLHPSQQEEIADGYSIFSFQLKLNYELVHEIMSLGDAVTVLEPRELKIMVATELQKALEPYKSDISIDSPLSLK